MLKTIKGGLILLPFLIFLAIARLLGRRAFLRLLVQLFKADFIFARARARILKRNIDIAFADKSPETRHAIGINAKRNFALLVGEFFFMQVIENETERIRIIGAEHVHKAWQEGKSVIFTPGHFSNWELLAIAVGHFGKPLSTLYRANRNPIIAAWTRRQRNFTRNEVVHKERGGTRALIDSLREGKALGILADQRKNDGMEIEFFSRRTKAPTAAFKLARRFDVPLIPLVIRRIERADDPSYFEVEFFPAVHVANTDDADADILAALNIFYRYFETWIRARPAEWFWYHNRWKDV